MIRCFKCGCPDLQVWEGGLRYVGEAYCADCGAFVVAITGFVHKWNPKGEEEPLVALVIDRAVGEHNEVKI